MAESLVVSPVGAVDFDGEELAWAQEPCTITYASVWRLDEAPSAAPDALCEPAELSLPRPAKRLQAGELHLTLTCPQAASATGCLGKLEVNGRRPGTPGPRGQALTVLGRLSYRLSAGRRRTVTVFLKRGLQRFLDAGRTNVEASSIAIRPTGEHPPSDPGVVSLRYVLRPPRPRRAGAEAPRLHRPGTRAP